MTRDRVELFVASFLMLFVELVLIRWAGAQVVHLSYFANFILLGSFLGIGIGFLRAHRGPDLFRWAPAALALLAGFVAWELRLHPGPGPPAGTAAANVAPQARRP